MTRKARVSLCMIVRDEAENLPRCLAAAKPYFDELCIVDTGSVDATVEIAREHGARVESIVWPDDFSEARNVSLEMATGDWILVLDADEVLRPGMTDELEAIVDNPEAIAAFLRFTNHGDDGMTVNCLIMRLFRNAPTHRFEGAIHEQVMPSLLRTTETTGQRVIDEALHIDHDGYRTEVNIARNKDERNRKHFIKALEKDPQNAYLWFKYGDFLRRFEETEEPAIIDALERSCAIVAKTDDQTVGHWTFCAEAFAQLALYRIRSELFDEARALLTQGLERCLPTATLYWVLGQLCLREQRWADALEAFETCRSFDGECAHIPAQPGITGGRSEFGMARALLGLGRTEEAVERFFTGSETWPDCDDLERACTRIEMSRREFSAAMDRCTRWLESHPEDGAFWGIGAEILLELGMLEQAGVWVGRAVKFTKKLDRPAVLAAQGQYLAAAGRFEEAVDVWNSAYESPDCRGGITLVFLLADAELPADLDVDTPEVIHAVQTTLRRMAQAPCFSTLGPALVAARARRDCPTHLRRLLAEVDVPVTVA